MQLAFHTLDVFTTTPFTGNPLAVVHDADGLSTERMQTIAREFGLPETIFVQKPGNPAHSAKVRIFTPATELPFAGHPTVGVAVLLAELRNPGQAGVGDSLIVLEENIGTVRVGVRFRPDTAAFAEFDAPKLPEDAGPPPSTDELGAALGLLPREIGFANHKPCRFGAGNSFTFVPVASLEAIARASVQSQHWRTIANQGVVGVYLYCQETAHTTSSYHARMFAPANGIPEDPATGSAAVSFAGVIQRFDGPPDGNHKRVLEQGYEMGRPSLIMLSLDVAGGQLQNVRIGGHAVRMTEGTIRV